MNHRLNEFQTSMMLKRCFVLGRKISSILNLLFGYLNATHVENHICQNSDSIKIYERKNSRDVGFQVYLP